MSNTYITSANFKNLLKNICSFQTLTTKAYIPDENGIKKESSIFYKMRIEGSIVTLAGHIVDLIGCDSCSHEVIAEEEFMNAHNFWIGDPKVVYADYSPVIDKKTNNLVWVAAYDRDTMYARFFVNLNNPIIHIKFSIKQLEQLSAEPTNTAARPTSLFSNSIISTTLNDGPTSAIPEESIPTGYTAEQHS